MPQLVGLGYVDRIFWNSGEHVSLLSLLWCFVLSILVTLWTCADCDLLRQANLDPNNPDLCNPSLTNDDGSPTDLLTAYGKVC